MSRPRLFETKKFGGCRDRDQLRLSKSCRDQDFIESLANHCSEGEEHSFNCLAIRGRGDDAGPTNWEDADCQDKLPFICEKDLHLLKKY